MFSVPAVADVLLRRQKVGQVERMGQAHVAPRRIVEAGRAPRPVTSASLNFQDWLKLTDLATRRPLRLPPVPTMPPLPPVPTLPPLPTTPPLPGPPPLLPPVATALPPVPRPEPPLELDAPPEALLPPEALEPSFPPPARPAEQAKKGEATAKTKNKVTGSCRPIVLFTSLASAWRPRRHTIDFE